MRKIYIKIINFFSLFGSAVDRLIMIAYKPLFKDCGRRVIFFPRSSVFSFSTISIGNNVFIGYGCKFQASVSSIKIGNKVLFGPNVTIMGGDHNTSIIGKYIYDVKYKDIVNDLPVVIEDDVWVAANVTILKGVVIKKGSIVAAGSVVTKSFPRYSIIGGVPAKVLKSRFSPEEIKEHERILKEGS
jgi:acetyltransferase-like isoleucine patch superfamily enzyme|tara:strand:- start:1550 stop:2107 length:558 start_codon:yes stop_codon:yes gene_type:complete